MADTKISALPASTTPLAGTEVLPIVQGGATVKVSVANLTAGRVISANGVAFPATASLSSDPNTLDDYEEGTWTPIDDSGAGLTFTSPFGYYTKVGDTVTAWGRVTYPTTASGLTALVGGLPFTAANNNQPGAGFIRLTNSGRSDSLSIGAATTNVTFYSNLLAAATNVQYTGARIDFVVVYKV